MPQPRAYLRAAALCTMNWMRLVRMASVNAKEKVWLMLREAAVAEMPMMPA